MPFEGGGYITFPLLGLGGIAGARRPPPGPGTRARARRRTLESGWAGGRAGPLCLLWRRLGRAVRILYIASHSYRPDAGVSVCVHVRVHVRVCVRVSPAEEKLVNFHKAWPTRPGQAGAGVGAPPR